MEGYKFWFFHGERPDYASTSEPYVADSLEEHRTEVDFGVETIHMVNDVYRENMQSLGEDRDTLIFVDFTLQFLGFPLSLLFAISDRHKTQISEKFQPLCSLRIFLRFSHLPCMLDLFGNPTKSKSNQYPNTSLVQIEGVNTQEKFELIRREQTLSDSDRLFGTVPKNLAALNPWLMLLQLLSSISVLKPKKELSTQLLTCFMKARGFQFRILV
ncbi:predicted protein [Arabidopsis lyrata subsp. lyrata]|uniref:Predicted protein n=1 Tax=Arabidopsis lyrata subsp. lyrata TaxID=81972 RepID=D7KPW6_ARALL|nr:predicted protein [Arabidopsis lyrata subsp. lyrata]